MIDTQSHIAWLLAAGRMQGLQAMADGLGARLVEDGMSLMRERIGLRTTHPLTAALSVVWEAAGGPIVQVTAPHGLEERASYIGSPMEYVNRTGNLFRRTLSGTLTQDDHVVLHEMKLRGATDYYALPLFSAQGSGGTIIFVCDGVGGFSEDEITALDAITAVIAPVVEAHGNYHLATAIAESYLGQRTGQRVLDGQITRGDIETIEAAILFSDIRGWTALNATGPATEALDVANRYFEVISDAVDNNDGEILKFLGDGVLALFPSDGSDTGRQQACRQAIAAAHAAHGIAALADLPVPFGIGIHYGEVLYGNVGARARIDFTILGQAVNIAARVESCCGPRDETVLVSDTVARIAQLPMRPVGTEFLKGLRDPMALHAPHSV